MRTLKYRGKCEDATCGYWHYFTVRDLAMGAAASDEAVKYDPESWRQYTGLKDKNGVEIYEGDILAWANNEHGYPVVFERGSWLCARWSIHDFEKSKLEVIGNIYENPDLLQVAA